MNDALLQILNFAPTPMIVRHQGKIVFANSSCATFFGFMSGRELICAGCFGPEFSGELSGKLVEFKCRTGRIARAWVQSEFIEIESIKYELIKILTDETESQFNAQRAEAHAASIERSRFLAAMSHEMRTPLNAMLNLSTLLKRTNLDDRQSEFVSLATNSAQQLLDRIEDVLEYSSFESEQVRPPEPVRFNPKNLLAASLADFERRASDKGLSFLMHIDSTCDREFIGLPERWQRVINHLCDNAIKYTTHGQIELLVEAAENGNGLYAEIRDSGIGIEPERLKTLFDPFHFDTDPTKRTQGGLSLGLALCKRLVESFGGEMEVESNPGFGTLAAVFAPFTTIEEAKESVSEQSGGLLNILVAEDNLTNQRVITLILEQLGHKVTTSENGEECLKTLNKDKFDAILMDLHMPVMDGYEATRRIRENGDKIPIIALTADNRPEAKEMALKAGMNGFLTKPLMVQRLHEALNAIGLLDQNDFESSLVA